MKDQGRKSKIDRTNSELFRARGNYFIAAMVELFCAFYLWSSFVEGGIRNIVTTALVIMTLSVANYAAFIKPKVIFSSEGIEIANPLSDDFIAWGDIDDIDARWCMTITSGDRVINVYGAPAPGRHRARNVHETEMRGIAGGETGFIRPARSPKSDSGAAVHIATLWQAKCRDTVAVRSTSHSKAFTPLIIGVTSAIAAIVLNVIH